MRHDHEVGHLHELTFSCYRRMPLLTNDAWREELHGVSKRRATKLQSNWLGLCSCPNMCVCLTQQPCQPRALSLCRRVEVVVGSVLPQCSATTATSRPAIDPWFARRRHFLRGFQTSTGGASGTQMYTILGAPPCRMLPRVYLIRRNLMDIGAIGRRRLNVNTFG